MHTRAHIRTGSAEKTKSQDVCGLSGSVHVSLERWEANCRERWGRELRHWETGGQANGHRLTVCALSSALAGGSVRQKKKKKRTCYTSASAGWGEALWPSAQCSQKCACCACVCLCKCLYLLSKFSCFCLKLVCRLVLSLEMGAFMSEWLCWLSFSSISTVQQEKPCGHTFKEAPGRQKVNPVMFYLLYKFNTITTQETYKS